jgi:small-conductance mechanosensitive channel
MGKVQAFLQLEPALVVLGFALASWVAYRFLLRDLSSERHLKLKRYFLNLGMNVAGFVALFVLFQALSGMASRHLGGVALARACPYLGLIAVFSGTAVFVKACRILFFEYLFFGHMKEGVPVLLVNLFTLLLSILLAAWIASEIFSIRLAPLLATSAIFSLVLGLALQDTLGNLFAGVALQMDKPYELGDWIEIDSEGEKWVGRIHEITWRATLLIGWSDEAVTVPNRKMAQAKISNYSLKDRPFVRSQVFRIAYGHPVEQVKAVLLKSIRNAPSVKQTPEPFVMVCETTESWIGFKLVYFLDDFGKQARVADQVLSAAIEALERERVAMASNRISLISSRGEMLSVPQ